MRRILSTYRYVHQILRPALIQEISRAGIPAIEVFCASSHFTYRSAESVRELAGALTDFRVSLHALHSPTERSSAPGRESGIPVSISETERIRRIDAMDEVKRALEVAETIPFRYLIQHMGSSRQAADPRSIDAAFSSLEHLSLFAKHRGVTIALENTPSEIGSPESLVQFIKETRLNDLRFCFDIGHANIGAGVAASFELMRDRIITSHIHDNNGEKDEHLLPYEGKIDWDAAFDGFASAPEPVALVLELKERVPGGPPLDAIRAAFDKLEEHADRKGARTAEK